MNKIILIIFICTTLLSCKVQNSYAQQTEPSKTEYYIETTQLYIGKNIYVMNPHKGTGLGFCIDSILINQTKIKNDITSSAIEISLENFQKCEDTVNVKIYHCNDCAPKFLGPELITPKMTVEFESVTIDSTGLLKWSTLNESWKGTFMIQRQENNLWHKVKTVESLGGECFRNNQYSETVPLTEGVNVFRILKALRGQPVISENIKITKK